jgi:hypothetical protein
MNFRQQLLAEPSRANTDFIVHSINGEKEPFEQLFGLIYDDNGHVANRAAWVVEKCAPLYPWLIEPHLEEIIDHLFTTKHDGSKRLLLKVISFFPIPASKEGELIDQCLTWLESPKEKVALKVYSMQILSEFCEKEPELVPEFLVILENHYEHNSIAFKSRANKVFKKFQNKK